MQNQQDDSDEEQEIIDPEEEEEAIDDDDYEFVLANFIGFGDDAERAIVRANTFETLDQLLYVEEKDIRSMVEELGKRTIANGRVIFGMGRTQLMIGLMHWVQDCAFRYDEPIDIVTIEFDTLLQAINHATARKAMKDSVEIQTKATTPGKFKKESDWHDWHGRFMTFLSNIPGMKGVPLSYIVRDKEIPDRNIRFDNFVERSIACAPLTGTTFVIDAQQVHSYLLGFVQGENTEQWVKHLFGKANGRLDIMALRDHYGGEGNMSRRLADADLLYKTLHYKSEKSLTFEKFLDRAQEMFNIYEENSQPIYDDQKIRWLLTKVQNSSLQSTIESIRVDKRRHRDLSYITACNDLAAAISELGENKVINRTISSSNTKDKTTYSKSKGTGKYGKKTHITSKGKQVSFSGDEGKYGYVSPQDWKKLSYDQRAKLREERDKRGFRGGTKTHSNSQISAAQSSEDRIISAITAAFTQASNSVANNLTSTDISTVTNNSGDAFGGQSSMKRYQA
jgi:hypothetical protein